MERQTTFVKAGDVDQRWHLVDASGKVLGRMAARIAVLLQGKHRPEYTPHVDTGDYIVVINAADLVMTGRKGEQKFHKRYSGYPGGLKQVPYGKLLKEKPELLVEQAVRRMLPKTKLGRAMFKKLKVYPGADHPHQAQQPEALSL